MSNKKNPAFVQEGSKRTMERMPHTRLYNIILHPDFSFRIVWKSIHISKYRFNSFNCYGLIPVREWTMFYLSTALSVSVIKSVTYVWTSLSKTARSLYIPSSYSLGLWENKQDNSMKWIRLFSYEVVQTLKLILCSYTVCFTFGKKWFLKYSFFSYLNSVIAVIHMWKWWECKIR